jgi:hypothetical protein
VESPDLVSLLEAKVGELHSGPSLTRPSDCADGIDLALAEREVEAEEQFGPKRDRLVRGEERSHGPELGDPSVSGVGAWDLVLNGEVAGNTGRASCVMRISHGATSGQSMLRREIWIFLFSCSSNINAMSVREQMTGKGW